MKFTVHENFNDMSLEDMLKTLYLPKKELHLLRMSKDIRINDETKPLNTVVQTGDTVLLPAEEEKSQYKPSYRTCEVLYEDRYLALLFKPRGVKTHPNQLHETNTLLNHALYTLDDLKERSEEHTSELQSRGHLVCRLLLDKENKP